MRKHGSDRIELIKNFLLTKQKKISLRESNLKELERLKKKKQLQAIANRPFSYFEGS